MPSAWPACSPSSMSTPHAHLRMGPEPQEARTLGAAGARRPYAAPVAQLKQRVQHAPLRPLQSAQEPGMRCINQARPSGAWHRATSTSARPPACGQCAWAGTQAPLIQRAGVEEPRAARLIENAGHLNIRQAAEELRKVTRSSGSRPGCAGSRACARHRAAPTLAGVPRRRPGVAWASCRAPTRTWLHHTVRGATGGAADRGVGPGRSLCRAVLGPRNAWPH